MKNLSRQQLGAACRQIKHSTAQHSTAQHSTAQHSTAQHSTAQHSTAQHSTAQHSTAQATHKAAQATAKAATHEEAKSGRQLPQNPFQAVGQCLSVCISILNVSTAGVIHVRTGCLQNSLCIYPKEQSSTAAKQQHKQRNSMTS